MRNWLQHLLKAARRGPHNEDQFKAFRGEGLKALGLGEAQRAIECLGQAVLLRTDAPDVYFDLGRALHMGGKIEAARRAYLRALDLKPNASGPKRALLSLPPLPPDRQDFSIGQRVSGSDDDSTFEVLDVRKGGFGIVYIVRDERLKIRCALKTFQAKYLWSDEDRKRFVREAITWLMLDSHPSIVTARGLTVVEGLPCLWLDYYPYNLAHALRKKPLTPELAVGFAIQFCDGMLYANQKAGIVHRDIKPSNCLLTENLMALKVTDFGLARSFAEAQDSFLDLLGIDRQVASQFTTVAGTPQYMAPEQFRAGATLDTRTDVYSFGIMLYEMLTKDRPLIGSRAGSHIRQSQAFKPLPARLKDIVLHCVEPDANKRPSDFRELLDLLDAAFEHLSGLPYPWQPIRDAVSPDWTEWNNKGIALRNLGYLEAAQTCGMKAVELNPHNATAWLNYGWTLHQLNLFRGALSCFEKGLEIDPTDAALWASKGTALRSLNNADEAVTCYQRALLIEPRSDSLWNAMGALLYDADNFGDAIACFKRSLEINPRNLQAHLNSANTLRMLRRYQEALALCEEALAIHPRYGNLWNAKALILSEMGDAETALVAVNRALEIEANRSGFCRNKGTILASLGMAPEAEKWFGRAKELSESENRHQIKARVAELEGEFERSRPTRTEQTGELN